jgi:hypothetical protein
MCRSRCTPASTTSIKSKSGFAEFALTAGLRFTCLEESRLAFDESTFGLVGSLQTDERLSLEALCGLLDH